MRLMLASVKTRFNASGIISILLLFLMSQVAVAQNSNGETIPPPFHETGHLHDHGDQIWPPQPKNATNIVELSKTGEDQARNAHRKQQFDGLERKYRGRTDVKAALGNKYTRIDVLHPQGKGQNLSETKYIYFSRDKNATVEITEEGASIKSIKSTPADEYQPEITEDEVQEATHLARQYFLAKGYDRIYALQGFGILAYSPEGKGFYNNRVIYISFHENSDARPEFMAWVNLTKGTIIKSREER